MERRKNFALTVIVCFMELIIGACNQGNPVDLMPQVKKVLPLKSGNRWELNAVNYDTTGATIDSGIVITQIAGDTSMYGLNFFLEGNVWWANSDSGVIYIHRTRLEQYGPQFTLEYKYPVALGDRFQSDNNDVYVGSVDTLIQVPAGSFRCIKYEFSHVLRLWDCYVSPGVGLVKSVGYFSGCYLKDPMKVEWVEELKSYRIN